MSFNENGDLTESENQLHKLSEERNRSYLNFAGKICKGVKMPVQWVENANFFVDFLSLGRFVRKEGEFEWRDLIELHLMVY